MTDAVVRPEWLKICRETLAQAFKAEVSDPLMQGKVMAIADCALEKVVALESSLVASHARIAELETALRDALTKVSTVEALHLFILNYLAHVPSNYDIPASVERGRETFRRTVAEINEWLPGARALLAKETTHG